ncbi:MAG: hypothetical protein A4E46_01312 [Methanosaeta sp. PtaU1.Bin016]|nr:MAG: hypothetical protein A4E46_01312 [Methanosaeta sp. PtaU1.Bin016]
MNSQVCSIPESGSEVEANLKRLDRMLQAAHRSSIDIKESYDFYILALKEFNKENIADAYLYYDRAKYELTSAINGAKFQIKGSRFHSLRTLSYFFKLYGLYAVIFGTLSIFLFGYLIYRYAQASILDVPLWSAFFAGLGSSAQILTGVADDLRRDGMVTRYKRLWYMAIPLLSLIFGYMAYLLFSSGLIAFNANSQSRTFSTMFVCFLTGFLTNWLINRLSRMSRDL